MDSHVFYLNPNQLADMSNYKINGVAPIAFAMITTTESRSIYIFPSTFTFPRQVQSIYKGTTLTTRPAWMLYLIGDGIYSPSYIFIRKILPGFQEPVFVLLNDNTPKDITNYYVEYDGEAYFNRVNFAFTYEVFMNAFNNIITAADTGYNPNANKTYISFTVYDNPNLIPIIDFYDNTEPGSDTNDIRIQTMNDLNQNTNYKPKKPAHLGFRNDTIFTEYPIFKPNIKPDNETTANETTENIKSLTPNPPRKHKSKENDNKVHFSASAISTKPNYPTSYEPMEIEDDWHVRNQNQSQGFYFETPNPNKTSNYSERQQNINNDTFEDLSTSLDNQQDQKKQPQSTKRFSFRIVSDPNDKNNNNNNNNNGGFDLN